MIKVQVMGRSFAYNEDCVAFMKRCHDDEFDVLLADPPYGIGEDGGKCRSGFVRQKNGTKLFVRDGGYAKREWDSSPPSHEWFEEARRISRHQIIFGVNHFTRYETFGPGRIVWDKVNDGTDQSDCEIAYNSLNDRTDIFRFMWRGMMQGKSITEGTVQQGNKRLNEKRIHPTQKPVALYMWIFQKYEMQRLTVFDPFLGSGSSRIAAFETGIEFTGCEIDPEMFAAQEERFRQHTAQTNLFLL